MTQELDTRKLRELHLKCMWLPDGRERLARLNELCSKTPAILDALAAQERELERLREAYMATGGRAMTQQPEPQRNPAAEPRFAEGFKFDLSKPRYDLISPIALEELAKVYTFGASKYEVHNWRRGLAWSRILAAMFRHLVAYNRGETLDPETGLSHMAAVMWNAATLIEYEKTHPDMDDRYRIEALGLAAEANRNPEAGMMQGR